jgi:hypothetical protein
MEAEVSACFASLLAELEELIEKVNKEGTCVGVDFPLFCEITSKQQGLALCRFIKVAINGILFIALDHS